ncbi:activating transcription factor 7-interacting protein 1-like [Ylistrum balloti]|uniref:activating transcription factor 7-interacting protein 1-like n=1 Tax=Ylistrum balloti TaxID=509963 RepID=UPI0029057FF6|nr:activating transcription factor 7-interacting protein 1-like [Ylistrum balloti]
MSATEKAVCSLTMPYPSTVGKNTNCVTSAMPVSEDMDSSNPTSTTGHSNDCNGGTNGVSKDISLNFTQTFLNLKALNGQAKIGNEDKKTATKEEDIVILDHSPSSDANPKPAVSSTSSSSSLLPASLMPKPPVSLADGVRQTTSSVYEHPKASKFEINDRVRSSFKDIMSKIQENTPSLQNLLAKTKDLDTRERKEERERLEREQAAKAMSTMGKGSGDNVFENLKGLNCDTDLIEKPVPKSVELVAGSTALSIKPSTSSSKKDQDVILLDDLEEDSKKESVESSNMIAEEQKEEVKPDVSEETEATQACDNSNNVQSTIRDSSKSPICIDIDNMCENENAKKSDSSSTLKAEEELLKIDKEEEIADKKEEEEMGINEEEERLLASDSDDDKVTNTADGDKEANRNQETPEKETQKMEMDGKDEKGDSSMIAIKQEGKDNESGDMKVRDNDVEIDVKGKNVTSQIMKEKDIKTVDSKGKEDGISVNEEVEGEVKKEMEEELEVKMDVDGDENSQSSSSSSNSSTSKSSQRDVEGQKDVKIEVKSEESGTLAAESTERKRPADSSSLSAQPKRSRLDMVIGKLGSAIGIQPDSLKDEPDEEMSDIEESHESEVTESVKSEDTTSTVSEDEDDSQDSPKKKARVKRRRIRLTEFELEQIVRTKVKMYMKVERDEKYKELQEKVEELTQNVDFWKSNYRELERQVLNVTILQQKHEKRKAKTAALRELSTKNVAVQVDENKANHMNQLGQQTTPTKGSQTASKTPTKTNSVGAFQPILVKSSTSGVTTGATTPILAPPHTSVVLSTNTVPPKLTPMTVTKISQSPVTSGSPCLLQSLTTTANVANNALPKTVMAGPMDRSVKTLLDNKRMVMPATKLIGTNTPGSGLIPVLVTTSQPNVLTRPPLLAKPSNTLTISAPGQSRPGDVVDLTGEEDTGMKRYTTPAAPTSLVTGVPQGIPVTTVQPGGLVPQPILRPTIPSQAHGVANNSGILLSTPTGTQIMRNPQQTFQIVFNSTSPAIRPGSLLTVMQGPGGSNQIIRPIMTTTSGQPPQLRAAASTQPPIQRANLSKNVASSNVKIMTRPPPPLQVAPPTLQVVPPVNSAPPPKVPEHHHPAPLPVASSDQVKPGQKPLPPKPTLKISRVSQGIVLSWNMTLNQTPHAEVASYQLFAYQEGSSQPTTALWKKVGDVKALPLPMACTLTQFQEGNRYHFAVRAVDVHSRVGPFSEPNTIHLTSKKD